MNLARIAALAWVDLRSAWRRPLYLILAALLGLFAFGLAAGNVKVNSGSGATGGAQAWINSEFNLAFLDSVILALVVPFFVAVAAGLPILNDRDRKVDRLLHSTPLSMGEYVVARSVAALLPTLILLGFFASAQMLFFQLWPFDDPDAVRGPFIPMAYVRPLALFGVPQVIFVGLVSAWLGVRTRQPILVFLLPVALLLVNVFFLWGWSPAWLSHGVNRFLQALDSAGVRWLTETWIKADRGVEFYNHTPVHYDGLFLASRGAFVLLGLLAAVATTRVLARRESGRSLKPASRAPARDVSSDTAPRHRPLPADMTTNPVGLASGTLTVLRLEIRQLLRSPGLWLFGPLILLQVFGTSLVALGAFDTPILHTSGSLASSTFNTLTLLLVLLILFYTVESMVREERLGAAGLVRSTGVPTASFLLGKILANAVVGAVILACALLSCSAVLGWQALTSTAVPLQPLVFVALWGLLLVPTLVLWACFVAFLHSLLRSRYAVWGVGLGVLMLTGWCQLRGWLNWTANWHLWSVLVWSDLDRLEWTIWPLLCNRALALVLAALSFALALRLYPRRAFDPTRAFDRLRPKPVLREALLLSPLWVTALVLLVVIGWQVRHGFQGGIVEAASKRYWQRNSASFEDAPLPALDGVDAAVDLDPRTRHIAVRGEYVIRNPRSAALREIPITPGLGWRDLAWTLEGHDVTRFERGTPPPPPYVEDRAGLWVFTLERPLAKDESVTIGFSYAATNPQGWTRNGGGVGQYVLPSGVVLTSFTPSFLPVVGYIEGVGVDEENRRDSREYPDDHWRGVVDPAFGPSWATQVRLEITGPADWTLNSVGVPTSERVAEGRKTVVWESDHPVRFFNIVGGPLEKQAAGAAPGQTTAVFHAAQHSWNTEAMAEALAAARRHYAEWFHPYPWRDLKLTEFPGLADYAQGFPGNISFSESIGFLAKPGGRDDADAVFLITAHEAAHQWWGNILMPGRGPGGNVLSEGMAHFSAAMLFEECRGNEARKAFLSQIEESYVNGRMADAERPLNKIDGSRPGDGPTTYDKGGWVFWMTLQFMGREAALAGIRDFIDRFKDGPDFPLIEDFVEVMTEHAPDRAAFEAFARQWFFSVVLPEFRVESATAIEQPDGTWRVEGEVTNIGTGDVHVAVGVDGQGPGPEGEAIANDMGEPSGVDQAGIGHAMIVVGPGATAPYSLATATRPTRVVVDPDVQLLQARRKQAVKDVQ